MFERFTERARQVIVLAQDESRALGHNYIGTEHLLLGLLREEEGIAARVLQSLDLELGEVRRQVARMIGEGDEVATGQIPFTPRAKKVLELSLREAVTLGHDDIGTEHILLGLVRENAGLASRVLYDLDVDARTVATTLAGFSIGSLEYAQGFGTAPALESPSSVAGIPPRAGRRDGRSGRWIMTAGVAFALGVGAGWLIWG